MVVIVVFACMVGGCRFYVGRLYCGSRLLLCLLCGVAWVLRFANFMLMVVRFCGCLFGWLCLLAGFVGAT